jgi:hypothetical protein
MKNCTYCGRENNDDAVQCRECGNVEFKSSPPASPPPIEPTSAKLEFEPLTPEDLQKDLITLMKCRTLLEADLISSRLDSAGIESFIPDQFLMQAIAWNLNTFGFVRLQVSPNDYEAAKEFLSAPLLEE